MAAPIREIRCLRRRYWRSAWAKPGLLPRPVRGSMGWPPPWLRRSWAWSAPFIWGRGDVARQQPNVYRMRLMGAKVVPVSNEHGEALSDAIDVALADWVESLGTTHYLLGTAAGPHPFPKLVKQFQKVISEESRQQMLERTGRLPDVVVACVGGGSNAIGAFAEYLPDEEVRLIGVEPAGEGLDSGKHGAPLNRGKVGVLHGSKSYVMLGSDGEVMHSHSVSAGLDYPGVGPGARLSVG